MQMLLIIMNTNFEKLGVIDNYISFIWSTRYYKCGDFELCLPINNKTLSLIAKDYYVMREDSEEIGIVENIKFTKVERLKDAEEQMIVSGRFLSSILDRRIIAQQTQFDNKTIPFIIESLINDAIISPAMSERKISNFLFVDDSGYTGKLSVQYTGKNLLETIENLCETYGLGFKILLENGKFVFHLYSGIDRSYGQKTNPFVVFSSDYDNLQSSDYEEDYASLVTDVLVAGEGEGLERKTIWANRQTNSGLDRYEVFQDARNASTNNGEISNDVYYQQLKDEGLTSITMYTKAFSGSVFFNNYEYKKDINIGDICTIRNSDWDIYINTRLIEMIESTGEDGSFKMTPTFGV